MSASSMFMELQIRRAVSRIASMPLSPLMTITLHVRLTGNWPKNGSPVVSRDRQVEQDRRFQGLLCAAQNTRLAGDEHLVDQEFDFIEPRSNSAQEMRGIVSFGLRTCFEAFSCGSAKILKSLTQASGLLIHPWSVLSCSPLLLADGHYEPAISMHFQMGLTFE